MVKQSEDLSGVLFHVYIGMTIPASQGELERGAAFVLGDERYGMVEHRSKGITYVADRLGMTYPRSRREFVKERLQDRDCLGFIPITESALQEVTKEFNLEPRMTFGSLVLYR